MSIKTTIGSTGVTETNSADGCVIDFSTSNAGFLPWAPASASYITAHITMSAGLAGLNIMSGTAGITASLPNPSTCMGTMFFFKGGSSHTHVITASAGASLLIDIGPYNPQYSKIMLYNSTCALFSDGSRYCLMFSTTGSAIA